MTDKSDEAAGEREEGLSKMPRNNPWGASFVEGLAHYRARDLDAIERTMQPIVESGDADLAPMAAYLLGLSRMTGGDFPGALDQLAIAYRSGHQSAARNAALPYGMLLAQAHRFAEAVGPLTMAARHRDLAEEAALLLARVHLVENRVTEAASSAAAAQQAAASRRASNGDRGPQAEEWFKAGLGFLERGLQVIAAMCFEEAALFREPTLSSTSAGNAAALYEALGRDLEAAEMRRLEMELRAWANEAPGRFGS